MFCQVFNSRSQFDSQRCSIHKYLGPALFGWALKYLVQIKTYFSGFEKVFAKNPRGPIGVALTLTTVCYATECITPTNFTVLLGKDS